MRRCGEHDLFWHVLWAQSANYEANGAMPEVARRVSEGVTLTTKFVEPTFQSPGSPTRQRGVFVSLRIEPTGTVLMIQYIIDRGMQV